MNIYFLAEARESHPWRMSGLLRATQSRVGLRAVARSISVSLSVNRQQKNIFRVDDRLNEKVYSRCLVERKCLALGQGALQDMLVQLTDLSFDDSTCQSGEDA